VLGVVGEEHARAPAAHPRDQRAAQGAGVRMRQDSDGRLVGATTVW